MIHRRQKSSSVSGLRICEFSILTENRPRSHIWIFDKIMRLKIFFVSLGPHGWSGRAICGQRRTVVRGARIGGAGRLRPILQQRLVEAAEFMTLAEKKRMVI